MAPSLQWRQTCSSVLSLGLASVIGSFSFYWTQFVKINEARTQDFHFSKNLQSKKDQSCKFDNEWDDGDRQTVQGPKEKNNKKIPDAHTPVSSKFCGQMRQRWQKVEDREKKIWIEVIGTPRLGDMMLLATPGPVVPMRCNAGTVTGCAECVNYRKMQ